jgi:hypothetical protein
VKVMRGKTLRQRIKILRDAQYSVKQVLDMLIKDGYSPLLLFILLSEEEEEKPRQLKTWLIDRITKIMLEDDENE